MYRDPAAREGLRAMTSAEHVEEAYRLMTTPAELERHATLAVAHLLLANRKEQDEVIQRLSADHR